MTNETIERCENCHKLEHRLQAWQMWAGDLESLHHLEMLADLAAAFVDRHAIDAAAYYKLAQKVKDLRDAGVIE